MQQIIYANLKDLILINRATLDSIDICYNSNFWLSFNYEIIYIEIEFNELYCRIQETRILVKKKFRKRKVRKNKCEWEKEKSHKSPLKFKSNDCEFMDRFHACIFAYLLQSCTQWVFEIFLSYFFTLTQTKKRLSSFLN